MNYDEDSNLTIEAKEEYQEKYVDEE